MADYLKVKVLSPNQILFQGLALSISSKNSFGNFDILPYHANFITLVQNQPITIRIKDPASSAANLLFTNIADLLKSKIKPIKFQFPMAIIYAANNEVKIYTDIVQKIEQGNSIKVSS